jgi:uncharacterized protein
MSRHCPICRKPVEEPQPGENSAYPFCSRRCQLIDLGRWLGEKYQIPAEDQTPEKPEPDPQPPDKPQP